MIARLANLSLTEKTLGVLAAVLVSFLIVDNLVAQAWLHRLQELDRTIGLERSDLLYKRAALAQRPQVEGEFRGVRERLGVAGAPAVTTSELEQQVYELARRSGVAIKKVEPREPRTGDAYEEYSMDIGRFEGDEKSVLRFASELWGAPGMLRVTRLSLAPNGPHMVKGSMLITKLLLPGNMKSENAMPSEPVPAAP